MANFSELHELLRSCIVFCAGTHTQRIRGFRSFIRNLQWLINVEYFCIALGLSYEFHV